MSGNTLLDTDTEIQSFYERHQKLMMNCNSKSIMGRFFCLILFAHLALAIVDPTVAHARDGSVLEYDAELDIAPTSLGEVIARAQVVISCPDGSLECEQPECQVTNTDSYVVEGQVEAASGVFASSYGNSGFSLGDGTGGIFVLTDDDLHLKQGDRVRVTGSTHCQFGTLALHKTVVSVAKPKGTVIFAPRAVGQLTKRPDIPGDPDVVPNWCDCLMPFSANEGNVISVRGIAVADLQDDGVFGFKLFLDDGTGVTQIFIDADSGVSVERIRNRLLVEGADLCVTGVVGQFAGVGYELLPRTDKDIRRARPDHKIPCP
jgi:hypothetical protein